MNTKGTGLVTHAIFKILENKNKTNKKLDNVCDLTFYKKTHFNHLTWTIGYRLYMLPTDCTMYL